MRKIATVLLLLMCFSLGHVHAAYLRNVPVTVTQPDGTVLQCFASGDEFFNYLHDKNGYTIVQHPQTGYYVYAENREGKLVATDIVAGVQDPASKGLQPYALISPEEWMARRKAWEEPDVRPQNRDSIPNHGTLNNLSIFIRFSDDSELTNPFSSIDNMFNNVSEGAVSMRSYFRAASYGAIEIPTTFYPQPNGNAIVSYQDTYPRNYFRPYNATSNPNGYQGDDERAEREFSLLERAVNYINANYPIPTDLDIDYNEDGNVDNVCFIVKGNVGDWGSILWPHKWALKDRVVLINGKRVWTFNFQLADATTYFNTSTMCHEMNHSLGAPDLYHYYHDTGMHAVGIWDLMHDNATPPQHCGAYVKMKYGHWLDEIPEITEAGTYTLNPISSPTPTNIAYKIQSDEPDQFYVLEYRDNTSLFETALPGSGLLIYRINTSFDGNVNYNPAEGVYDEVYIFRPEGSYSANGNLSEAYFNSNVGRTEFSFSTSAYPFFSDGTLDNNFRIYDITTAGNTISFKFGTSSDCEPPTNLIASVEGNNVSLSWDAAPNAASYNIYRHNTLVGNASGTTYLDSNLDYGRYIYSIRSVDADGIESTASETAIATILPEGAVFIGDGSLATDNILPSYTYYKYSLTQQIYTPEELGDAGVITSIAFYNGGAEKTRTYDLYLKNTEKTSFSGKTDWITVSEADKVFSGSVTMAADTWTVINLSAPFAYDGISNVVLVADDNTGQYSIAPYMSCRVFDAPSQALYAHLDTDLFNPLSPPTSSSAHNDVLSVKNQLIITKVTPSTDAINITVRANPAQGGMVSGGGAYYFGETCTVTATVNAGYRFLGWMENGQVLTTDLEYSFTVVQDRDLVAMFEEGMLIGDGGDTGSLYLPSHSNYNYSLTQQIYTAEEIGTACTIKSIAFYNRGTERTRTYNMYLVHTDKATFSGNTDWIAVTEADKVFSGNKTMVTGDWTVFTLDTPFEYNGTSNLALIMDDNTCNGRSGMSCKVFNAPSQTLRIFSDGTNYNPSTPYNYTGTVMNVKNQIILSIETGVEQTVTLSQGWNWFCTYIDGDPIELLTMLEESLGEHGILIESLSDGVNENLGDGFWMGDLDGVGVLTEQMYMIEVDADCTVELQGVAANAANHAITIYPGQWNWIGFPCLEEVDLAVALSGFEAEEGDLIESLEGGIAEYLGDGLWMGFETMVPGQGYMYYSNSTESKTLIYVINRGKKAGRVNPK